MKRQLPVEGRTFQFSDSYIIHDASLDSSGLISLFNFKKIAELSLSIIYLLLKVMVLNQSCIPFFPECRVGYEHRSGSIAPAVYMHTPLLNSDDCGQLCDVFDMSLSRTCCSYEYYHSGTDAKLCKLHDQCDPTGPNSDDVYFCARGR